ncbi:hypothetical protein Tsubulata_027074 [Turnera subulata]|uniref:Cytochrome P450 n=1 Tax=Turnera subulata TaxID=218843 RepID=A0A9Q0FY93_9ROSI|nr:hypothetical protein Tsubulata_027074 [Turnera subulata]
MASLSTFWSLFQEICVAGSETSATAIEWTLSELMKNPSVMEKAQSEVRQVLGKKSNIEEADLGELKYLKLVLKEIFRLHPPNPMLLPRESLADIKIGGYDIPAKTKLIVNAWAIQRDPQYWDEPERFYPERFIDSNIDFKGSDFELLPFGGGRRMCPGIPYTVPFIELTLANLLCHFDWKLPTGMEPKDLDMTEAIGLIARRKNDLHLVPVPYPLLDNKLMSS